MSTIVTRSGKGSPLTNAEVDSNFTNLNTDKAELSGAAFTGAITTNSTVDGVDIATRDAILTSTTTTANAALPKAGGAMSGAITTSSTFDGRNVSVDGTKLDGIEASATADQTGAQIKTAYEAETNAFTDAQFTKLGGIEALATVTNTASVTAAGALMDSELTSIASVKALNQGLATGNSPTFVNVTATSLDISGDIDVDGITNLDVVDIDGAVDMASTLAVSGALKVSGQNTVHSTNSLVLGQEGSGVAQLRAYGPNGTTKGQFQFAVSANDGSPSTVALAIEADSSATFSSSVTTGGAINNNAGSIVIGTTSLSQPILQFLSSTSGANTIHFGDGSSADAYRGYINYSHSNDRMEFATAGQERLRISSTGAALFNSTVTASGAYTSNMSGGQSSLQLEVGGANKAIVGLEPAVGGGSANDLSIYSRSGALRFWANGAEKLTIATNGAATFSSSISAVGQITSARGSDTGTYGFRHEGAGKFMRMGVPNASFAYFETDATGGFSFEGNVSVANKIIHAGDTNTYIEFTPDVMDLYSGGTLGVRVQPAAVTINEGSVDADFRVESNDNTSMLFVDGGANKVGIGDNPTDNASTLQVTADATVSGDLQFVMRGDTDNNKKLIMGFDTTTNIASITSVQSGSAHKPLHLQGSEFVWNEDGSNHDFRVESDGNANMLFVDGGNNHVGIGTATLNRSGLGSDHICLTVGADSQMGMLELQGTRTSNADLGRVSFLNAGTRRAEIVAARIDADNSTKLYFQTSNAGSLGTRLTIGKDGAATFNSSVSTPTLASPDGTGILTLANTGEAQFNRGIVVNEGSYDSDFRVESDNFTHAFFVQGSDGNVGLNTIPSASLHVNSTSTGEPAAYFYSNASKSVPCVQVYQDGAGASGAALVVRNDGSGNAIQVDDGSFGNIVFAVNNVGDVSVPNISVADDIRHTGDSDTYISFEANNQTFYAGGTRALDIAAGSVVFNEGGGDVDFRVESNGNANMFYLNGGVDKIGMGRSANLRDVVTITGANSDTGFGTTTAALEITNSDNSTGHFSALNFRVAAGNYGESLATVSAKYSNYSGNVMGELSFGTRGASSTNVSERMRIDHEGHVRCFGQVSITGALSKGSGSFKIDHPLDSKKDTHHLIHSFIEGPQADNIYRGKVNLVDGSATVNIDTVSGMSEGTYVLLNTNTQCFTSNESGWTAVKGSVLGNILTITAQESCSDTISWMVVGERHDQHMLDAEWTDGNGKVIVEPLKELES